MVKEQLHRPLTVITALWVIGALAVRIRIFAIETEHALPVAVRYFLPEITVAAIFAMFLPAVWVGKRWVSHVLAALAVLLLVLLFIGASTSLWFVSFLLLLFLAFVVRSVAPGAVAVPAHPATWLSLVISKGQMYLGTPGAYLQLSAGALGAVSGFKQGHWALAMVLLICSLLGLYGLWTIWGISTRTWAHGRYVVPASGRINDVRGLLAAWIAVGGLAAISKSIFREEDVLIFAVLLGPSLLVTTAIACVMKPEQIVQTVRAPLSGILQRTRPRQYIGMVAGLVVGLLCAALILPPTPSGWGPCDWTIMFPIGSDLWPIERMIIFDGCSTGVGYQTTLLAVASFIFWISGLLAIVIGKSADPWHGAITAAVTASIVLTWTIVAEILRVLALPLNPPLPISEYVNWISTMGIAIAVVLWASRLGYLGGRRGSKRVETAVEK